jgi:hypothetical protein
MDEEQPSAASAEPERARGPAGPRLGVPRLTPTRVILAVAILGSAGFVAYAFTVRDLSQVPLLAAGLGVLGLAFAALAVTGAISTYRAGALGAPGRALGLAVLGGVAAMIAMACFTGAVILAILSRPR